MKEALLVCINGTKAERVFLCEHSFILFVLYYFTDYIKVPLAPYHYEMAKDLLDLTDRKIRECAWIMYRESAKSTFAKLFILWLIAYQKRRYINVDSFDKENSERILFDVAFEMVNNKLYQQDFGVLFSKSKGIDEIKQNRINNFVCENGIRCEAHSTQESVRGRLHLNQRPDALVLDDFENNKTRDSQAYTKQVADHISEAMAGMSSEGFILYLGNYITEYGNVQFLLDRAKSDAGLRIRNVPVLNAEGEPNWRAKYALTDVEAKETGKVSIEDKKRQLGSHVFSYEMMNEPVDESLAEFKKEWVQEAAPSVIEHLNLNTFVTFDPAVSERDAADFTGITINRISSEGKRYITCYRKKFNAAELIDHMFYLNDLYKPTLMGMEEGALQLTIKPFLEEQMRKRGKFFTVVPLKHGGTKKETRIRSLIPVMESKSYFFVGDCADVKEEMRTFPRGTHDDCLDSLAYSEQIAYAPNVTKKREKPPNNPYK
jgi:phage terminase large subunit-like protein